MQYLLIHTFQHYWKHYPTYFLTHMKGKEYPFSSSHLAHTPRREVWEMARPLHVLTCSESSGGPCLRFLRTHIPIKTLPGEPRETSARRGWAPACQPCGPARHARPLKRPRGSRVMERPRVCQPWAGPPPKSTKTVSVVTQLIPVTEARARAHLRLQLTSRLSPPFPRPLTAARSCYDPLGTLSPSDSLNIKTPQPRVSWCRHTGNLS